MRKFAALLLLGFFSGVAVRSFLGIDLYFLATIFIVALFLCLIFRFGESHGSFLMYTAIFLTAFSLGALRYEIQDNRSLRNQLMEKVGSEIELSGIVKEDPQKLEKFTRVILDTSNGRILINLPHYPEVSYGDKLTLTGKLEEPQNFSDFDWKNYLAKDGVYFQMYLPKIESREEGNGSRVKKILLTIKHKFIENLSRVLPEPHSSFLAGVTIGERTSMPDDLEENFRSVGVIHLIVLSGYNISIISDNVIRILGYLPIARLIKTFIATIGIILFAIMTGGSATVVRAAIMGILILWARETGKIYQALSALIFAAFLMILINPKILRFDASFQLSFLATAGLIFLSPRLEKYFKWLTNKFKIRENLVSTISTQIFVLPLLISLGGSFSWVTLPANLMILSVMPITMFFGFLTGLSGFISYNLSWLISWPAYWLLAYELWVVKIFS